VGRAPRVADGFFAAAGMTSVTAWRGRGVVLLDATMNRDGLSLVFRHVLLAAASASAVGCSVSCGASDDSPACRCDTSEHFQATVPLPASADRRPAPDAGVDASATDAAAADAATTYTQSECRVLCAAVSPPDSITASITRCQPVTDDGGAAALGCWVRAICIGGRAPKGYSYAASGEERADPGAWLAALASLERASVVAFETLADQLAAHGAPGHFVDDARTAADDERRHAARVAELAASYGRTVAANDTSAEPVASLEALALENAVEGCVRETWGALVAHWQTSAAGDPRVRDAMRDIADEETAHATLSWRLAAWFETRLDGDARRRVRAGRERAVEALARDARNPWSARCERALGLPSPAVSGALLDGLRREVWRD
jgi:hypothetical protein